MIILKLIDVLEIHVHFKMIILKQEQLLLNYTFKLKWWNIEALGQRCSVKKVFLEISQNWQENSCARFSFLIKFRPVWHRCFPMNFAKFLRTLFLREHLPWLPMKLQLTIQRNYKIFYFLVFPKGRSIFRNHSNI